MPSLGVKILNSQGHFAVLIENKVQLILVVS